MYDVAISLESVKGRFAIQCTIVSSLESVKGRFAILYIRAVKIQIHFSWLKDKLLKIHVLLFCICSHMVVNNIKTVPLCASFIFLAFSEFV